MDLMVEITLHANAPIKNNNKQIKKRVKLKER
jgi:hypothetical protein